MKKTTYAIWKHERQTGCKIPDELWDEFASEKDAYRHLQSLISYGEIPSLEEFIGEGYNEKNCSYYLIDSESCYDPEDKDCHDPDADEGYFEIINPQAEDVGDRHPVYILPFAHHIAKPKS